MNKYNQKHLTISDRLYIEQELLQGTSFKAIAKVLHKDPTTISKEVKRARTLIPHDRFARKCKLCHFYSSCSDKNLCHKIKKHPYFNHCNASCKKCYRWNPQDECPNFLEFTCNNWDDDQSLSPFLLVAKRLVSPLLFTWKFPLH